MRANCLRIMTTIESNAAWLLFTAKVHHYQRERGLLACLVGRARGLVYISGGGGADPDHELRQSVRERLADGRLFFASGMSIARRGRGHPCVVCGQTIDQANVEREVEDDHGAVAVAHDDCYRIWREESRRSTE